MISFINFVYVTVCEYYFILLEVVPFFIAYMKTEVKNLNQGMFVAYVQLQKQYETMPRFSIGFTLFK